MAKQHSFYGLCARAALSDSFSIANAWAGLWGPFLLWGLTWLFGRTMTLPDKLDWYALWFVLALLGATWMAVFLVRLVLAPPRLYWKQVEKAATLRRQIDMARRNLEA